WSLCPAMMYGTPGSETPVAWNPGARRSAMYQMLGTLRPRCMSFESSGFPVAVCAPEMTQLLEPGVQPEHESSLGLVPRLVVSHPSRKTRTMDGARSIL